MSRVDTAAYVCQKVIKYMKHTYIVYHLGCIQYFIFMFCSLSFYCTNLFSVSYACKILYHFVHIPFEFKYSQTNKQECP
jgi:hypothetical protein